ncbi:hypothetical protein GCM10007170_32360 [Arthrobacter liuii]|uniref:Uncharacterized protein n=1 Tax=Arthrobacter liuii TaxID=1476996 RepID=A0ABQ2AY88_9MICC|nr:hypothetical protein GCM10007170_32360 [Arthrobacter liuii]
MATLAASGCGTAASCLFFEWARTLADPNTDILIEAFRGDARLPRVPAYPNDAPDGSARCHPDHRRFQDAFRPDGGRRATASAAGESPPGR